MAIRRPGATTFVVGIAVLAVAVPVLAAIGLSQRAGLSREQARVERYAADVLARNDALSDEMFDGIGRLGVRGRATGPCSAANLALMREIDLTSSSISAIGHVEGDELVCSSLGAPPLHLGPVDVVGKLGTRIRRDVRLPIAPRAVFDVAELDGYAAIVDKQRRLDVSAVPGVVLATYSMVNGMVITSRGAIDPAWAHVAVGPDRHRTFRSHGYLVAITRSARWYTGSIAAVPLEHVGTAARHAATLLIPLGMAASALAATAIACLSRRQNAMPALVEAALRRGEFFVEYQPIVELDTGRWCGAEVLLRWRRRNGELVRPDVFVPIAEEAGLGSRLTARVLELVSDDAPKILSRTPDFRLTVNLTAADVHDPSTVDRLGVFLRVTGAKPSNLAVELTERELLDPDRARPIVRALHDAGIAVVVDDFGTGYSALSYLRTYELDGLKIDKSFVDTLRSDHESSAVVFQVIRMAQDLHYAVVAEGVETERQAEALRHAGVRFAQGWLFSKSLAFPDLFAGLTGAPTTDPTPAARRAPSPAARRRRRLPSRPVTA